MKFLNFLKRHIVVTVLLACICIATVIGVIKVTASSVAIVPSMSSVTIAGGDTNPVYITISTTISKDVGETEQWTWTSSDESVVTVSGGNSGGTIYPQAAGKANVLVTVELIDPSTGDVTVTQSTTIPVTVGIAIDTSAVEGIMTSGGTATVTVNGSAAHPITWSSSNDNIVSVVKDSSSSATLTFVSGGTAQITASIGADSLSASFIVTVGVSINEDSVEVNQGETVSVTTNSNSASSVYWWSADENVATVAGGNITGVYAGSTTVYGSCVEGDISENAGDYVTVNVPYVVDPVDTTVTLGDSIALHTTANPDEVNFYSESNNIITYDTSSGMFKTVQTGTATIHAVWNGNDSAFTITVMDEFSMSASEMYLNIGDTGTVSVTASDSTNPVYWSIGDDTIASIEVNGAEAGTGDTATVTGLATGQTTVVASQTINGVVKTKTCYIYVLNPVTSLTLLYNGQEITDRITIPKGQSIYITAYLNMEDSAVPDNTKLSWVSSDDGIIGLSPTTDSGQQQLCKVTAVDGGTATITVVTDDGLYIKTADFYVSEGVTGISLDATEVTEQMALGKYQLTATITPDTEGVDKTVIWSSLDPSVVSVDQNGLVTFVAPGTTYILATSNADPTYQASCKFTITQQVEDVEMDYDSVTLNVGDEYRLTALITPSNATNQNLIWSSSNESVVTVDGTGLLKAKASGSATIVVQTEDGGYIDMTNVTVLQPVTSVTLSETEVSVKKGTIFYLDATCNPNTADDKRITWASSDTSLATVDQNGKVTTLAVGTVTISAMSVESGAVAYCLVEITEPVTGLTLNSYYEELVKDTKFVIIPTVLPTDAVDKSVTYVSSDPDVASVDENGIVTALMGGTAEILVTTNESKLTATCTIVVKEFVESITITGAKELLNVDDTMDLDVTVKTDTASNKGVIWSSSNSSIATVDQDGKVTGVAPGNVVITALAADGSGVSDSVVIRVINPVDTITLSQSKITIYVGETYNVTAKINPEDASIKTLEWISDDETIAKAYEDGDIVGVSVGRTVVRVHSMDGNDVVANCTVIVKEPILATSVILNSDEVTMLKGKTRKLVARIYPRNTNESLNWLSTDTSVVQVDPYGNIVTVGAGTAEVIAYSSFGTVQDTCIIHSICMNTSSLAMEQYDTYNLYVDGAVENISWRTSNPRIATVDQNGKVTGRMPGECVITATTDNKTVTCYVKIYAVDPGKFINVDK